MNRAGHEKVNFFAGTEVEHTPAHGRRTLFVVGVQQVELIAQCAEHAGAEHIFFGANHSFNPTTAQEWTEWEIMITHFLDREWLCSLDIPVTAVEEFNDGALNEYHNFVPQIRVSIPYIAQWNYNTMLKIDDNDFAATNPGVWTHSLHQLQDRSCYTSWGEYSKDDPIDLLS